MSNSAFVSGQSWTGALPNGWAGLRSKRVFGQSRQRAEPKDEQLSVTQKGGIVRQTELLENGQRVVLALTGTDNFKHVEIDDFVISLRSFQGGIEWSNVSGCVSPAYTVLRASTEIAPRYWSYLFKSAAFITALRSVIDEGIRDGKSITYEQFGETVVPVPPLSVQVVIAAHLDRVTSRIDALVAKKTRVIELLREKRQAVITHAVTKGLDPNVPMKDSGVEWLGRVPVHWKSMMLRRAVSFFQQGWSPDCDGRLAEINEWGVTKSGCVNGGVFRETENKALPPRFDPKPSLEIMDGDVLMSRASGSPSLIGSAAYVSNPRPRLMISDKIFRLITTAQTDRRFLVYALGGAALRRQIEQAIGGAEGLANNLSQQSIKELWLAQPPLVEQTEIVAHLDHATTRIDTLIAKTERSIELLREHRTALITAAVTGKIDLRPAD